MPEAGRFLNDSIAYIFTYKISGPSYAGTDFLFSDYSPSARKNPISHIQHFHLTTMAPHVSLLPLVLRSVRNSELTPNS